jgi:quercetin dioxygenase-like cupin family protein
MNYTRIYCDAAGESHFEDVPVAGAPADFAPPAPPLNLAAPMEAERVILCDFPRGWVGDWHPSPRRQFYVQMSGQIEVQVSDGEIRRLSAGSLALLDDTSGKGHLTKAIGDAIVQAVFVQLSAAGDAPE